MRVCFLVHKGFDLRYRCLEYMDSFKEHGVEVDVLRVEGNLLKRYANFFRLGGYDVVIIQRKVLSSLDGFAVRKMAGSVIFDFDDAIMYRSSKWGDPHSPSKMERFERMIRMSDRVFAGNSFLKAEAARFTSEGNVAVVPTVVDLKKYSLKDYDRAGDTVTIGWLGSGGTIPYLEGLKPALEKLGERYPNVRLKIVCDRFFDCDNMEVVKKQWSADDEVEDLKSFDIGVMPLTDDIWTRGKCGLKLLQYMGVGLPVVCSPVGANRDIVADGVNGFWASTEDEWVEKLSTLVEDAVLRRRMGMAGYERVRDSYSVEAVFPTILNVVRELAA
ncbi:MAG: glycosyltransferase family 4 protein [Thermodesulfobacteriota bacterium]